MVSQDLINAVNGYENYISIHGIDENVIDAYIMAAETAINVEKDLEYGLELTKRVKEIIEKYVMDLTGGTIWDLEKYCFANKVTYEIIDKWYAALLPEAQNKVLDSYLRYLERKREPKDRYYEPKRKQFLKIGLIQALQDMLDDKLDILSISMPPGTGKAQPLYSKVLTPKGFVLMKDIKVGDEVLSGTGKVSKVLGVYPQGIKSIYEIIFDDGSKCRCCDEHLWTVQTRDDRRANRHNGKEKYRTIELKEMMKNLYVEHGKRKNYSINYVPPIDFEEKQFVIHPYVMGVLLGDGGLSSGGQNISTTDMEILERIQFFLPEGYTIKHHDRCTYAIRGSEGSGSTHYSVITKELKRYGLDRKKSKDKFIPKEYLYASKEQRLWLLRGLMDTDGTTSGYDCSYSTISEQLANDVVELVHSLGGYASKNRHPAGYKKDGEYIRCNDVFDLIIQFDSNFESIFALERHKTLYSPKRKKLKRFVSDVRYVGEEECQCIYIDDESHLYITDDYIITHNTTIEKFLNSGIMGWFPKDFNLFYSHSGDITRMYYDGVQDILTNPDEYTWNEIFPDLKVTSTNAKMEQLNIGKYKPFPNLQCTSVGSKNAGKVRCNKFLLCDDLIGGIEEALNKNRLDNLWNIYSVDARQRKIPGCKEIHIATRWSVHDVIGRLERLYAGSDRVRFIAVPDIDPATGESNFDFEFNGFDVNFFHDQELAMDEISYKCLYKNEPIEREGLLYHEDDLRRYLQLPLETPDAIIGVCDTKDKGTDYLVLPCLYVYGDDYYCVDCICDNGSDYGIQYQRCTDLIVNHMMQKVEIEHNTGGGRVAYEIAKMVEERKHTCNITSKYTTGNKETKIIVNADWVKKHVIFKDKSMYTAKEDYGVMMSLLLSYSIAGKNATDDVPDVFAMLSEFVQRAFGARVSGMINPFWGGMTNEY